MQAYTPPLKSISLPNQDICASRPSFYEEAACSASQTTLDQELTFGGSHAAPAGLYLQHSKGTPPVLVEAQQC